MAGLATWHERHAIGEEAVASVGGIIPHTLAETFAVLTGMPPPFRSPVAQVQEALHDLRARHPILEQSAEAYEEAIDVVRRADRAGGAVYDALVARTAARANATLVTLDGRAKSVYLAAGVTFESLG